MSAKDIGEKMKDPDFAKKHRRLMSKDVAKSKSSKGGKDKERHQGKKQGTDDEPISLMPLEPTLKATPHSTVNTSLPVIQTSVLLDTGAQVNSVGELTAEGAMAKAVARKGEKEITICSPLGNTCIACSSVSLGVCLCNEGNKCENFVEEF